MTRRLANRILLSLLLLVSQQMAIAHVIGHWNARAAATVSASKVSNDDGLSSSIAQDQRCDQCLAFAQIASAVGQQPRAFVAPRQGALAIRAISPHSICARAPCAFLSRAPPAA
jgi:hypothetical protein